MRINIRALGFELTDSLRERTERCLRFALGWVDDHLRQVSVRLYGQHDPRGKDKRCRIQIEFSGAHDVVIEDIQTDLHVAITRAADRAARSVAHLLERQHDHRHDPLLATPPAHPVTLSLH